jgi:hypothetical protein
LFIKPLKQLRYETCCNLNFIIPPNPKPEPLKVAADGPLQRLGTMVSGKFGNPDEHLKICDEDSEDFVR